MRSVQADDGDRRTRGRERSVRTDRRDARPILSCAAGNGHTRAGRDGLDNALWCYAFATVIFAGALSPLLVVILLCGWAMLGMFVALTSEKRLHIVSLDDKPRVKRGF